MYLHSMVAFIKFATTEWWIWFVNGAMVESYAPTIFHTINTSSVILVVNMCTLLWYVYNTVVCVHACFNMPPGVCIVTCDIASCVKTIDWNHEDLQFISYKSTIC